MAARALVIAIENYPAVTIGGVAKKLPGTLQAGLDFKTWLTDKWTTEGRATGDTQILFCSEPARPGGAGATRRDILTSLLKLKQDGQNSTEELYVFFSGHGFSFVQRPGSRADVLLTSEFENAALGASSCLNLDEIVAWLRDHLGPGRHFYFVDACRNALDATQIQVGPLLPIDPNTSAEASTFVLQSTVEGATGAVGGPFPSTLLAGLRGNGKAKAWDDAVPDAMLVRYDSLRQFLKASLVSQPITSRVNGPEGESDAILAVLRPIPLSRCTIQIVNARADDTGELFLKRRRSTADERRPLASQPLVFQVEPDNYTVAVRLQNAAVTPSDPVALDLFEDRTAVFTRLEPSARAAPVPSTMPTPEVMQAGEAIDVEVVVPPKAELWLRNLETGSEKRFKAPARVSLMVGRYFARMAGTDGTVFQRREVTIAPGMGPLNLTEWRNSAPHVAIASHLAEEGGGVDFSESLNGGVTDADLDLWLALVGGGRLLLGGAHVAITRSLPVSRSTTSSTSQRELRPSTCWRDSRAQGRSFRIGVSRNADVVWGDAIEPPGMSGIREAYVAAQPGWLLVSFGIEGQAPYTLASLASPNRAMLITLTLDDDGSPRLSQYLLPLGGLLQVPAGRSQKPNRSTESAERCPIPRESDSRVP